MNYKSIKTWLPATIQIGVCTVAIALPLLVACGGKISAADTNSTGLGTAPFEVTGTENFLVFPNPLSSPAIDSTEYAQTYYNMIDPNNERDTLTKWKAKNGFGNSSTGEEIHAVFGDVRDLGYGRNLTARWNNDDTWAFMVDNYSVAPAANYAYTKMNIDVAIAQDPQWYGGTNAIEVSPGPYCDTTANPVPNSNPECKYIVKFYNFDPKTGARNTAVNLDGLGVKAMPGICLACHGGRGDEILPPSVAAAGHTNPIYGTNIPALFPIYATSGIRGDVKGKLHAFEVDTFDFSTQPGYTRADQEATLKKLNQWVLCTYPMPNAAATFTAPGNNEDDCRQYNTNFPFVESSVANVSAGLTPSYIYPQADSYEWQSPAADIIKNAYGGQGMPNAAYSDIYVPSGWLNVGQSSLYENVVKPACRVCHLLRGAGTGSDSYIDFASFKAFADFADRIKYHVIDKGNMPLSRIVSDRFWATPNMYNTLAQFLQSTNTVNSSSVSYSVTDSIGAILRPGRPIANPGPDRVIGAKPNQLSSSTQLSAKYSLYADSYVWTVTGANAASATLSTTTGPETTFSAIAGDTYQVQLVASKGGIKSDPVNLTIVVKSTWPQNILAGTTAVSNPLPTDITFQHIDVFLNKHGCTSCHSMGKSTNPPIFYKDSTDRNGDGIAETGVDSTDNMLFYSQILSFVNFTDPEGSELLRHPAGYGHGGGTQSGFKLNNGSTTPQVLYPPGDSSGNRDGYDMFLNWILNGAPYK